MTTYRELVYSILEQINKDTDDAKVNELHVLYWVRVAANAVLYDSIKKGNVATDRFLVETTVDLVEKEGNGKKYFVLPYEIFNLFDNKGIHFVGYTEDSECDVSIPFGRTTVSKSRTLYLDNYTAPSLDNPYFYLLGNKVFVLGLECSTVEQLYVVLMTTIDTSSVCSLDEKVNIPEEKIGLVYRYVLDLCKFKILTSSDLINNGSDVLPSKNDYALAYSKQPSAQPQETPQE